jgi:hypothetical protein
MSQTDTQEVLSEDIAGLDTSDNVRLVPVAESIRYRKRAQTAEKKLETLSEQLAAEKAQTAELSEQLSSIQTEQKLIYKLTVAGAVDLEAAMLLAKARMQGKTEADLDACIEQLKKQKQYLFGNTNTAATTKKTAAAKERTTNNLAALERAAKRASVTGNRADLQEYLKLRRNCL